MQAETIFAIADLQDRIEDLEREAARRIDILEQAYYRLLPRNDFGLTDEGCVLGWRMLQVAIHGADPKKIIHRFPPERTFEQEEPATETGIQNRYRDERP